MFRFNSTTNLPEYYNGVAWTSLNSSGGGAGAGYLVDSKYSTTACGNAGTNFGNVAGNTTATISTVFAHGLTVGTSITTSGWTPTNMNGTFTIATVPSSISFTFTIPSSTNGAASGGSYCAGSGGLAAANAACLTDLTSNGTSWFGYAQANAAGWLNSTHVKAFLCDGTTCNNLDNNTTYYYSSNFDSTAGGGSFTSNGSGQGPNDSVAWNKASRFGGAGTGTPQLIKTGRGAGTATLWATTSSTNNCTGWTVVSSGVNQDIGQNTSTGSARWLNTTKTCNNDLSLVCEVNP
jgi:hypothetical protein